MSFLSNGTYLSRSILSVEKLYCSIWWKSNTGLTGYDWLSKVLCFMFLLPFLAVTIVTIVTFVLGNIQAGKAKQIKRAILALREYQSNAKIRPDRTLNCK